MRFIDRDKRDFAKNYIQTLVFCVFADIMERYDINSNKIFRRFISQIYFHRVLLLYLKPREPNFILKFNQNYKRDVSFYVDCI